MPSVSLARPNRFKYSGYLSFVPSTVIFSRAVINDAYESDDTLKLLNYADTYSGTGTEDDVREGQTVLVYAGNTDALKGRLRVATGGIALMFSLPVNEFSRGDLLIEVGDRIDILAAWDPREMLVKGSEFLKDSRIEPGTYAANPPPVCNSGGPIVGFISGSSLSAGHYGSTSWRVDPDSGSLAHAWDFIDATPSSSTDADPTGIAYPEGFRWIEHTVADDNGRDTTQFVPVWAHGPNYKPLPVRVDTRSASIDEGYHSLNFSVPRAYAATVQTMMDRCLVCYWEKETHDGVTASYGTNVVGREHVKFVGYLDSRSISISADGDTLSFTAIGPAGIAAKLGALSQVMKSGTVGKWTYVKTLTVWRALWYLLYWGSTLQLVHDFLMADGDPYLYSALTIDNVTSIKGQMDDLAHSIAVRFCSDQIGRMLLWRELPYLSISDRAARTKIINFTTGFIVTLEWEEPFRPATKLVLFDGITAASDPDDQEPVKGWAPGNAPGEGTEVASLDKQIAVNAAEGYQRVGDEYARLNGRYWNESDNTITRVPMGVRMTVIGAGDVVDPCLGEPISIALPASTNTLGLSFTSSDLWIVRDMTVTYDSDAGTKAVTYTIDHETHGIEGVARPDDKATSIDADVPPFQNYNPGGTSIPIPYDPLPDTIGAPTGKLFGIETQSDKAFATLDGSTYFLVGDGTITGDLMDACSDPYNYGRKEIITADGLWQVDDPYGAPTVASLVATEDVITGTAGVYPVQIQMCINRKGFMACPFGFTSVAVSLNRGASWTRATFTGGAVDTSNKGTFDISNPPPGIAISQHNNPSVSNQGWIWGCYWNGTNGRIYLSKDWGATWTHVIDLLGVFGFLHIPYTRDDGTPNINDANQYVLFYTGSGRLFKIKASGAWSELSNAAGYRNVGYYGLTSYTLDGDKLAAASAGPGASPSSPFFSTSENGGGAWTTHSTVIGPARAGINGWPSDPNILLAWSGATLILSSNRGSSFANANGNLGTLIASRNFIWATLDLVDVIPPS